MATFWQGTAPGTCDACNKPLNGTFYDALLAAWHRPMWCCACQTCFTRYNGRTGTGKGQKYELQADGKWLKTEG